MQLSTMLSDIARALDPALWFYDAGIGAPDAWQLAAIRSTSKRQLWNCHRQSGKSTTAALAALHHAQAPGSLALLISPSQRQSAELLRKVADMLQSLQLPKPLSLAAHKIEFQNGARILSMPASEGTVRGYSGVGLLVLDEASRIPDEIIAAVRPMMATSDGTLIALSTPAGRRGWFYEAWQNGGPLWERQLITAGDCPRISQSFLDEELATLGPMAFQSEYECKFLDSDTQAFSVGLIERAFSNAEVLPLWQ